MKRTLKKSFLLFIITSVLLCTGIVCFAAEKSGYVSAQWKNPMYPDVSVRLERKNAFDWLFSEDEINTQDYYLTLEEAAAYMRELMVEREEVINVCYAVPEEITDSRNWFGKITEELFYTAVEHTGNGKEGDAILWCCGGYLVDADYETIGDYCYLDIVYEYEFYTSKEDEEELDEAVDELIVELDVSDGTNFEKSQAIYDYICANVTYDYDHLNYNANYLPMYTAHAALIDKTAVCQGYALLYYRLALELDVDARFIGGYSGEPHAWNIVRLGDVYYNLDSTWDAGLEPEEYEYYLRGSEFFDRDHLRDPEYLTDSFLTEYPVPEEDFDFSDYDSELDHIHRLNLIGRVSPTCEEEGSESYECDCGYTQSNTLEATGHILGEYEVIIASTCTEEGSEKAVCINCSTYCEKRQIAPKGHSYDEKITAPTCLSGGYTTFTCKDCGYSYIGDETQLAGHTAEMTASVTPTCTEYGYTDGLECKVCKLVIVNPEKINPTGHSDINGDDICDVCFASTKSQNQSSASIGKVTQLKADRITATSVSLVWYEALNAEYYEVYYTSDGISWKKRETYNSYITVKRLESGKKYQFKIVAVSKNEKGEESRITVCTKPSKVSLKSVKVSGNKAVVKWDITSDASGYEILYSTSKKFSADTTKKRVIKKAKVKKATIKKLKKGNKYFIKVRAYKTVSGKKTYGAYSRIKTVTVK